MIIQLKIFLDDMNALVNNPLYWPSLSQESYMSVSQILQHSIFFENTSISQTEYYENNYSFFVIRSSIVLMDIVPFLFTYIITLHHSLFHFHINPNLGKTELIVDSEQMFCILTPG